MITAKKDKISGDCLGTGRRKTAVARVRIRPGSGKITVNGREFEEYFPNDGERRLVIETLDLARALVGMSDENFTPLRDDGFLTRDSRMKERKKYGLRGARRGVQFSKR